MTLLGFRSCLCSSHTRLSVWQTPFSWSPRGSQLSISSPKNDVSFAGRCKLRVMQTRSWLSQGQVALIRVYWISSGFEMKAFLFLSINVLGKQVVSSGEILTPEPQNPLVCTCCAQSKNTLHSTQMNTTLKLNNSSSPTHGPSATGQTQIIEMTL